MIEGRVVGIKSRSTGLHKPEVMTEMIVRAGMTTEQLENLHKQLHTDIASDNVQRKINIMLNNDMGNVHTDAPYQIVKDIYVNEVKKTVTVKFKDGKVITKTASDEDVFDVYAGVALCVCAYLSQSTKRFHGVVDHRIRSWVTEENINKKK